MEKSVPALFFCPALFLCYNFLSWYDIIQKRGKREWQIKREADSLRGKTE